MKKEMLRTWLALLHIPGLGPATFSKLAAAIPELDAIFRMSLPELQSLGLPLSLCEAMLRPDWAQVDRDCAWADLPGNAILTYQDSAYPPLLKQITSPPPILYVRGHLPALLEPQIAIVGSRHPSPGGIDTARHFAYSLAKNGIAITSGLALGIDGVSHQGCLQAQGITIAVMGTGLEQIYPARHKQLAQQIAQQGALVSEFSPNTLPHATNFPRRNRLISGMSAGVLVIEAALQSGSLITARYALEQGREVFAIPGSIHNPLARGCHALIRQGAKLVETLTDILEELGGMLNFAMTITENNPEKNKKSHFDKKYVKLIANLGYEATSIDKLVERTGLTADVVSSMLLELELQGQVVMVPGGYASVDMR